MPPSKKFYFVKPSKDRLRSVKKAGHKMWSSVNIPPTPAKNTPITQSTSQSEQLVVKRDPKNPNINEIVAPSSENCDTTTDSTQATSGQIPQITIEEEF